MSGDEKSPLEAIASDISGVPGLSTAVKLVEKIAKLALKVSRNKYVPMLSDREFKH